MQFLAFQSIAIPGANDNSPSSRPGTRGCCAVPAVPPCLAGALCFRKTLRPAQSPVTRARRLRLLPAGPAGFTGAAHRRVRPQLASATSTRSRGQGAGLPPPAGSLAGLAYYSWSSPMHVRIVCSFVCSSRQLLRWPRTCTPRAVLS